MPKWSLENVDDGGYLPLRDNEGCLSEENLHLIGRLDGRPFCVGESGPLLSARDSSGCKMLTSDFPFRGTVTLSFGGAVSATDVLFRGFPTTSICAELVPRDASCDFIEDVSADWCAEEEAELLASPSALEWLEASEELECSAFEYDSIL
jgi:hypothetical protein